MPLSRRKGARRKRNPRLSSKLTLGMLSKATARLDPYEWARLARYESARLARYKRILPKLKDRLGSGWSIDGVFGDRLAWAVFQLDCDLSTRSDFQMVQCRWANTWSFYFSETGRKGRPALPSFVVDFLAWCAVILLDAGFKRSNLPDHLAEIVASIPGKKPTARLISAIARYARRRKLTSKEMIERGRAAEFRCRSIHKVSPKTLQYFNEKKAYVSSRPTTPVRIGSAIEIEQGDVALSTHSVILSYQAALGWVEPAGAPDVGSCPTGGSPTTPSS